MTMAARLNVGKMKVWGVCCTIFSLDLGPCHRSLPHRPQKRVQALGASPGLPCHLGLEISFVRPGIKTVFFREAMVQKRFAAVSTKQNLSAAAHLIIMMQEVFACGKI